MCSRYLIKNKLKQIRSTRKFTGDWRVKVKSRKGKERH